MVTKRTNQVANRARRIVQQEGPIDVSGLCMFIKEQLRMASEMDGDKKVRFAKSTGEVID